MITPSPLSGEQKLKTAESTVSDLHIQEERILVEIKLLIYC